MATYRATTIRRRRDERGQRWTEHHRKLARDYWTSFEDWAEKWEACAAVPEGTPEWPDAVAAMREARHRTFAINHLLLVRCGFSPRLRHEIKQHAKQAQ